MIIVGVDFSAGSAAAASVALRLAVQSGAAWRLIHVRSKAGFEDDSDWGRDEWIQGMGLIDGDVEFRSGVPWIELVRAVGESDAALLVAGTHGRSGFQPLRLGQTAELVSLRSHAPVMLVPPFHKAVRTAPRFKTAIS